MKKPILSLLILLYLALSSSAMVVTVSLTWTRDLSVYNLQEGSIMQVVAYNRNNASAPGSGASSNFDITPDASYDPYTTPLNHNIVFQTSIENGRVFDSFELLGNYDRLYIRMFQITDFGQDEVALSRWGLTQVRSVDQSLSSIYFNWNNRPANNGPDPFRAPYFEVIPEPSTFGFMVLGGILLFVRKFVKY